MEINISTISWQNDLSVSLNDLKLYLKIDNADEDCLLTSLIKSCEDYLLNKFGLIVTKKQIQVNIFTEKDIINLKLNILPVQEIISQQIANKNVVCVSLIGKRIFLSLKKNQNISIIINGGMDIISDELKMKIITHASILYAKRMSITNDDMIIIDSLYECYKNFKVTI